MQLQRPKAFAGLLIVGLIALVGFAAFSATGLRTAPPLDLPDDISARIAGNLLAVDLGPDLVESSLSPTPVPSDDSNPTSDAPDVTDQPTSDSADESAPPDS